MPTITMPHWIDGEEYVEEGVEVLTIDNPATGEIVGGVAEASTELLDRAIASARVAQKAWGRASLAKRSRVMFNFRQLLIERQEKARRALSDIGCHETLILIRQNSLLQALRLRLDLLDRGALRQPHIDKDFGARGLREEVLWDELERPEA